MRVLDRERGLADAAQALHGGATDGLRHGRRLLLDEDGIEPIEFLGATGEERIAWRHADKRPRWWRRCLRLALGRRDDAPLALIPVIDADEVLICYVREKTLQWRILAAQDATCRSSGLRSR